MTTAVELRQPPVFKLAFWTAMCERFGFYVFSYMLVLFAKAEYGLSDTKAFELFGVVTALSFILPVIGGYLGDHIFGIKRCMALGLFVEAIGLSLLAFPSHIIFPFALALIVIGVGLYKTSPTNLLGRSYQENDPRIDSGFTLFYMAMNIGSFISAIISGVVQRYYGWHTAFLMGGLGIFIGLIVYFILKKNAFNVDSVIGEAKLQINALLKVTIGIIISCGLFAFLISHATLADAFFAIVTIAVVLYFIYEIIKSPIQDKQRIAACLILILIGMAYFILYMQAYTSMTLFINRNVAKTVFGFSIPTQTYLGLNSFWVIVLGPILALFYRWTAKKYGTDFPVTTKFSFGLLVVSLCFFSLVASSYFADANAQVNSLWVVLAFGFYTLGEMLVSALGVAMVTHIVPKRLYGVAMGTWFLGTALAAAASSLLAGIAEVPETIIDPSVSLAIYTSAFTKIGVGGLVCTLIVFIASPYIKRMANLK